MSGGICGCLALQHVAAGPSDVFISLLGMTVTVSLYHRPAELVAVLSLTSVIVSLDLMRLLPAKTSRPVSLYHASFRLVPPLSESLETYYPTL